MVVEVVGVGELEVALGAGENGKRRRRGSLEPFVRRRGTCRGTVE